MDLIRDIANKDLVWAPILMVILISLIGFGIGFWNGWKTAAYFFTWNVIGALTFVLVAKSMYGSEIKTWAKDMLPSNISDTLGKEAFDESLKLFQGITVLLVMLAGLIFMNLMALVVYFFLRKHLKRDIFLNKKNGISNATSRISGGGIGVFTALPFAAALGVMTTGVSQNAGVNQWTSGIAKIATFGQVEDSSQNIRRIYNLALTGDASASLVKLFSADTSDLNEKQILDNAESVRNLLGDADSMKIVLMVMDKHALDTPKTIAAGDIATLTTDHPKLKGLLKGLNKTEQDNLEAILTKVKVTDTNGLLMNFLLGTN